MIAPAFYLASTERVLPKLALDFTKALLESRASISLCEAQSQKMTCRFARTHFHVRTASAVQTHPMYPAHAGADVPSNQAGCGADGHAAMLIK